MPDDFVAFPIRKDSLNHWMDHPLPTQMIRPQKTLASISARGFSARRSKIGKRRRRRHDALWRHLRAHLSLEGVPHPHDATDTLEAGAIGWMPARRASSSRKAPSPCTLRTVAYGSLDRPSTGV